MSIKNTFVFVLNVVYVFYLIKVGKCCNSFKKIEIFINEPKFLVRLSSGLNTVDTKPNSV